MIVKNIDKVIQQTLKNRERALGRKTSAANDSVSGLQSPLSISDMASRTVFVRMISNRKKPVVLQGGELKPNTTIAQASDLTGRQIEIENTNYNDMKSQFGFNDVYKKTSDGAIRYLSGLKDISVEYKGGYSETRTANVNWTVGSLDDLDRLTPHFLTPGLTVLLDWGWVMKEPPSTFFNDGRIDSGAFNNPLPKIYENKGNYDAIAGIVSNFNYKLNEDGTFDCSTTITAKGVNLFKSVTTDKNSNSHIPNSDGLLELSKDGLINSIINLPRIIIHDVFGIKYKSETFVSKTLALNDKLNPFSDIKVDGPFDDSSYKYTSFSTQYIIDESKRISEKENSKIKIESFGKHFSQKGNIDYIAYLPIDSDNAPENIESNVIFIKTDYTNNVREDFFVTWGWFEDNIISKYSSLYPENEDGDLINGFRSIDTILPSSPEKNASDENLTEENSTAGATEASADTPSSVKRSVKIRNNVNLQYPVDALKFILPGQHIKSEEFVDTKRKEKNDDAIDAIGGNPALKASLDDLAERLAFGPVDILHTSLNRLFNANNTDGKRFDVAGNFKEGYLRNVLINVKEIQKAFGIKNPDGINEDEAIGRYYGPDFVEPVATIHEGMMNLASALSENHYDFWNFKIVSDSHTDNVKMIDTEQVEADANLHYTEFVSNSHQVSKLGLYKFPTFQAGSIVKSQTLESKIIDAVTITSVYGSNQSKKEEDKIKFDLTNQSPETQLLFSNDTGQEYEDGHLDKVQKAYVKIIEKDKDAVNTIGSVNSNPNEKISLDGGIKINPNSKWWASWSSENEDTAYIASIVEAAQELYQSSIRSFQLSINDGIDNQIAKLNDLMGSRIPGADAILGLMVNGLKSKKFPTEEEIAAKAKAEADEKARRIDEFQKGESIYILSGEASNGEQYEIIVADTYVSTIKERLFTADETSDLLTSKFLQPIDLSLEIDGISGIIPGNIIQSDYMPKKYNTSTDGNGPFAIFQIFGLTQKVGLEGWTTEFRTQMRTNPNSIRKFSWEYSEVDKSPKEDVSVEQKAFIGPQEFIGPSVAEESDVVTDEPGIIGPDSAFSGFGLNNTFTLTRPVLPAGRRNPSVPGAEAYIGDLETLDESFNVDDDFSNLPKAPPVKVVDLLKVEKPVPEIKKDPPPPVVSTKAAAGKKPPPLLSTFKYQKTQLDLIADLVPGWDINKGDFGYKKKGRASIYGELPKSNVFKSILALFWDNYCELPNATGQSNFPDGRAIDLSKAATTPKAENWAPTLTNTLALVNYHFPLPNSKIILSKTKIHRTGAREKIKFENGKVFSWNIIPKV